MKTNVGKRIRDRRKELGLSAEEVAVRMKVSPTTIYRYESESIASMGIDKLEPIAEALQTTPSYLMGWTDNPSAYELLENLEDSFCVREMPELYFRFAKNAQEMDLTEKDMEIMVKMLKIVKEQNKEI